MGELNNNGPDQGDPAAWMVLGRDHDGEVASRGFFEVEDDAVDMAENVRGGTVVPLYRAPGAVAAAPPGVEEVERATAEVRVLLYGGYQAVGATRGIKHYLDLIDAGWRLVPPAPPAGYEDEAAVERAARVIYEERPTAALDWDETKSEVQDVYRGLARAALAAARSPQS